MEILWELRHPILDVSVRYNLNSKTWNSFPQKSNSLFNQETLSKQSELLAILLLPYLEDAKEITAYVCHFAFLTFEIFLELIFFHFRTRNKLDEKTNSVTSTRRALFFNAIRGISLLKPVK